MIETSRTSSCRLNRPAVLLGLALVVTLQGCGGSDSSSPSTPTSTAPQTITTTLPAQTFVGISPGEVRFADVTSNVTGTLTASLNWTFSSNDMDIYVTSTSCSASTTDGVQACTRLGRTVSTTAKPETLTVNVTPLSYRVWAANFGPSSESGTLSITFSGTR